MQRSQSGLWMEPSELTYVRFVPAVFSSLSLGLLPERSATLMVYEDVVQIVSGFQGTPPIQKEKRR